MTDYYEGSSLSNLLRSLFDVFSIPISEGAAVDLWNACSDGNSSEVSRILRDAPKINIDHVKKGQTQRSFLQIACENGHPEVVRILLQSPRNVIVNTGKRGRSPLWLASKGGHEACIRWLLASNHSISRILKEAESQCNAMEIAEKEGHGSIVALLKRDLIDRRALKKELREALGVQGHYFLNFRLSLKPSQP